MGDLLRFNTLLYSQSPLRLLPIMLFASAVMFLVVALVALCSLTPLFPSAPSPTAVSSVLVRTIVPAHGHTADSTLVIVRAYFLLPRSPLVSFDPIAKPSHTVPYRLGLCGVALHICRIGEERWGSLEALRRLLEGRRVGRLGIGGYICGPIEMRGPIGPCMGGCFCCGGCLLGLRG